MIVVNPAPLDTSYVPEKLFFRDDKIAAIQSSILNPSSSGISNNIIIHGASGTGKTSTVKFLMRDNKSIIYENALSFKNIKALLEHLLSRLGRPVSYRGLSFPDIFSTLNSIISFRGNTVLVIDEGTSLLKSDTDGLYNLLRAPEIYGTSLSTILISMENPFSYMERKYGIMVELKFNKYSGTEIYRIISERATLSLENGTYNDSILKYISDISAPVGSARFAIELLQKAAYMAEYRLSGSIENDDVRSAVSLINPYITESKLSLLDKKELLVLLSICRAMELKNKGMSDKEISTELHLSVNTITWLLSKDLKGSRISDTKIGWRSIGVFGNRIEKIAEIMADIVTEEVPDDEITSIMGITINGIPYATMMSDLLDRELIVYRPHPSGKEGLFSSNFAGVNGKKVVIVDDVISTGETMKRTIDDVRNKGGEVSLCIVLVSKLTTDEINGVRVRSLIRATTVG